jgi:GrpB-like predicted nucleotidyltransferase (UPF0157 family)
MNDPVVIVPYDPAWPEQYEEEKGILLRALGPLVVQIDHIGSTAVPGLGAKPVIDVLMTINSIADVKGCVPPLKNIGYEHLGEYGIPGRHFFRKLSEGTGTRTHHLHAVGVGNDFVKKHLLFRDYLRSHPQTAQQYYHLKIELAAKHTTVRDSYTDAKTEFIESVLGKANAEPKMFPKLPENAQS